MKVMHWIHFIMKNITLLFTLFLSLLITACGGGASSNSNEINVDLPIVLKTENFITQFGITWYFDKPYPTGQFANGDYYVVGPVKIVGINPPSALSNGRTINGSMINPSPLDGLTQGYDSATYTREKPADFDANMNVARPNNQDLSDSNPLVVPVNSSLVSSISHPEAGVTKSQLQGASILTVLGSAPPEGSFRPAYSAPDKSIRFNKSQIDYSLFKSLTPASNTPSLATVERYFERPWLDHVPGYKGDYIHPIDNMHDYGRENATSIGTGALMLNLNFTNSEKETLAIRFIQIGIDMHGIIEAGGKANWTPGGGHASGRKLPILMAGHLLNYNAMKNIGQRTDVLFGEDAQTFYVSQTDIDNTHAENWDPDVRRGPAERYTLTDIGLPEWGIEHQTHPWYDNKAWSAYYRRCCTGNAWGGMILTVHIMGLKTSWNHDALFDYQDRYMNTEAFGDWHRAWSNFQESMWDTYRSNY